MIWSVRLREWKSVTGRGQGLEHSIALSPVFILVENDFLATTHQVGLLVYLLKLHMSRLVTRMLIQDLSIKNH